MRRRTAVLIVALAAGAVWLVRAQHVERAPFDSARWKAQGDWKDDGKQDKTPRLEMIDSLLADHSPMNKSRAEVEDMLGDPQREEREGDLTCVWHYVAGSEGFLESDNGYLVLTYGSNDRVGRVGWR